MTALATYEGHTLPTLGHKGDAEGAMRYIVQAYEGEPLVMIRGRDILAIPTLRAYVEIAYNVGLLGAYNEAANRYTMGQSERMDAHRSRFGAWQMSHRALVKVPDVPTGLTWEDVSS